MTVNLPTDSERALFVLFSDLSITADTTVTIWILLSDWPVRLAYIEQIGCVIE